MNYFELLINKPFGMAIAVLLLMAMASFLTLWTLRGLCDEKVDEEARHRDYENVLFAYGACSPYYGPDILASKPHRTDETRIGFLPQNINQSTDWPELADDLREEYWFDRWEKAVCGV